MGTQLPLPKWGGGSPQFSAHICCRQMAGWIKMPLGMEIGLVSGDFVLDGDPAPPSPKRERSPLNFSAHVHCGQTAGWIKMILGTEVGLSSGDFVLHGDQAPSPNVFGPFLLWPNGWMHEDATWYGGRPQPRGLCVRWGPSPPPKFSAHVYYTYCDFAITLHRGYWFVQVQVLVFCAFCFWFRAK